MPRVDIFEVDVAVPGDTSWCARQTEQFEAFMAERTQSRRP
jgi:hypothetical protein